MKLTSGKSCEEQNAYVSIAEFFDAYSLEHALRYARRTLMMASGFKRWRTVPANCVYFLERLEILLLAAITIHRTGTEAEEAKLTLAEGEPPPVTDFKTYCSRHLGGEPWYFFPRHLSRAEVANPYRAFRKIAAAGRKSWKRVLKEVMYDALGCTRHSGPPDDYDALEVYLLLCKLLEAAHLIYVRALDEIDGKPLPKWNGLPEASPDNPTGEA